MAFNVNAVFDRVGNWQEFIKLTLMMFLWVACIKEGYLLGTKVCLIEAI